MRSRIGEYLEDLEHQLDDLMPVRASKEELNDIKEKLEKIHWNYQDEEGIYLYADELLGKVENMEIKLEERGY